MKSDVIEFEARKNSYHFCQYKINEWAKTNRIARDKCKRIKGVIIKCIGENDCQKFQRSLLVK